MITTDLTTLKINKLTKAQYEAALAAGNINENELYMTPESESGSGGASIATYGTTLTASNWNSTSKTYSFESDYPNTTHDIEIALDSTATTAQAESFNGAQIVGSATSNIIKAYGDVPTVDIPIILKVVTK